MSEYKNDNDIEEQESVAVEENKVNTGKKKEEKKTSSTYKLLIIICILLVIILRGLVVFFLIKKNTVAEPKDGLKIADGEDWDGDCRKTARIPKHSRILSKFLVIRSFM